MAQAVNKGLLDYLGKISKGEYVDVLNVDYHKFSSQDYWLSGRMKSDMMAYKDIPWDSHPAFPWRATFTHSKPYPGAGP